MSTSYLHQTISMCFILLFYQFTQSFANEEGNASLPVFNAVEELTFADPHVREWNIRDCFESKPLELFVLFDANFESNADAVFNEEKKILAKLVETLDLGPSLNKLTIVE